MTPKRPGKSRVARHDVLEAFGCIYVAAAKATLLFAALAALLHAVFRSGVRQLSRVATDRRTSGRVAVHSRK